VAAASEQAPRDGVPEAVVLLSPACASYDSSPIRKRAATRFAN